MYCGAPTQVANSRSQKRNNTIWRRRSCTKCDSVITTIERADLGSALRVSYAPHRLVPFSRDILFVSIYEACKHRSSAVRDAINLTDLVIGRLIAQASDGLIQKERIAATTVKALQPFDGAAAAVYAGFHSTSTI